MQQTPEGTFRITIDHEPYTVYVNYDEGWLNPWATVIRDSDQVEVSDVKMWADYPTTVHQGDLCGILLMSVGNLEMDGGLLFTEYCSECTEGFEQYQWRFIYLEGQVILCADCADLEGWFEVVDGTIVGANSKPHPSFNGPLTEEEIDQMERDWDREMEDAMQMSLYGI
jgi:hypothetical protein